MFCGQVKEYLSQKQIKFDDRDITKEPSAILELQKLGIMTTPVTVVDDKVIVGFDVPGQDFHAMDQGQPGWPSRSYRPDWRDVHVHRCMGSRLARNLTQRGPHLPRRPPRNDHHAAQRGSRNVQS